MAFVMPLCAMGAQLPAEAQSAYDSRFLDWPTYNGRDLELTVDNSGTHFRLWSPKASEVKLNLYDNGHTGAPIRRWR